MKTIAWALFFSGITMLAIGIAQLYMGNIEEGALMIAIVSVYFLVIEKYRRYK